MNIRWRVCALLFFATTINYMDRQIFSILGPTLQAEIGWSESQYGLIVASFTMMYSVGLFMAGRILDRVGVRKGFAWALGGWSLAAMAHALAATPIGFGIARGFLGLTESANFPSSLKATAEWFPKKERSFATGIFNSGSNVGVILAALMVPFITLRFGWRMAFVVQGAIGFIWLLFWIPFYRRPREHKSISKEELAHIESDQEPIQTEPLPWKVILKTKGTWAYALGKFMTDPVWWFYLFWLPKYLANDHGIKLDTLALPLIVIYVTADFGSVGGGWISTYLIKRGKTLIEARRIAMFVCALAVVPTLYLPYVKDVWTAVALVSLAAAAHQGWSANLYNVPSDLYPQSSVATIVGFGGALGTTGAMIFQAAAGYFLEWSGNNYAPIFMICGSAYILAWFVVTFFINGMTKSEVLRNT